MRDRLAREAVRCGGTSAAGPVFPGKRVGHVVPWGWPPRAGAPSIRIPRTYVQTSEREGQWATYRDASFLPVLKFRVHGASPGGAANNRVGRGRATVYRLAWLADVALALDRMGGFPGGYPGKDDLAAFLKRVKKPLPDRWDDLGRPADKPPTSPLWKRWRINYAADLATFRQRTEDLVSLAKAEGRKFPVREA